MLNGLAHGEVGGAYGFWWDVLALLPEPMAWYLPQYL